MKRFGEIAVFSDIAMHVPSSGACAGERAEWHVHLNPQPRGVWVSIVAPDDPRHLGAPLGWRPRLIDRRDRWWRRLGGTDRGLEQRVADAVHDAIWRIRRHEGTGLTADTELHWAAAAAAVDQVIERYGEEAVRR